jgi:small subunit ribosomal protein S6
VNTYETTFILEPGLDEGRVNEEVDRVGQWIKDMDGEVIEIQRWGKRRLSYEINRKRDGIYTLFIYQGPGTMVKEIERRLKLNESVMRVLTVLHVPPDPAQTGEQEAGEETREETREPAAATADDGKE